MTFSNQSQENITVREQIDAISSALRERFPLGNFFMSIFAMCIEPARGMCVVTGRAQSPVCPPGVHNTRME